MGSPCGRRRASANSPGLQRYVWAAADVQKPQPRNRDGERWLYFSAAPRRISEVFLFHRVGPRCLCKRPPKLPRTLSEEGGGPNQAGYWYIEGKVALDQNFNCAQGPSESFCGQAVAVDMAVGGLHGSYKFKCLPAKPARLHSAKRFNCRSAAHPALPVAVWRWQGLGSPSRLRRVQRYPSWAGHSGEPMAFRPFGDLDPSAVKGAASHCGFVAEIRGSPCTLVVRAEVSGANRKDS